MNVPQAQHHPYPTRRRIRSTIQVTKKLLTAAAFLIFTICSSGRLFVTLFDSTTAAINYGSNPDDVRSRLALPVLTRLENTTTKEYPTIANTSSSNSNSMHEDEFDTVCLTTPCLIHEVRKYHLARAFPSREKDSWCIPTTDLQQQQQLNGNNNNNNLTRDQVWQGLLYVKVPKAASSTTAGLTIRVARRHHCAAYEYMHRPGMEYASRDTNHSLLFASIRDPGERALSSVWFFVLSPSTIEATDTNIITSLHTRRGGGKTRGKGGFQYNYVSLQPIPPRSVWTPFVPDKILHAPSLRNQLANLLRSYDFLIVVERMDESMTAFALLAGLSMSDVLVASSKVVSNEYVLARVGRNAGVCEHKGRPPTSPGIRAVRACSLIICDCSFVMIVVIYIVCSLPN
jgi:hypothetical protein